MTIPIPSGNIMDAYMIDENDSRKLDNDPARREWWRWHMATEALVGLLAAQDAEHLGYFPTEEAAAKAAVKQADALIAELEKEGE